MIIISQTFQVAPVAQSPSILTSTAPTMQKGFGSNIGLGTWQQQHLPQFQPQQQQSLNSMSMVGDENVVMPTDDSNVADDSFTASSSQQPHRRYRFRCPAYTRRLTTTMRVHRQLLQHPLSNQLTFMDRGRYVCVPRRHLDEIRTFIQKFNEEEIVDEIKVKPTTRDEPKRDDEGFVSPFPAFRPRPNSQNPNNDVKDINDVNDANDENAFDQQGQSSKDMRVDE